MTDFGIRTATLQDPPFLLRDSTLREGLECPVAQIQQPSLSRVAAQLAALGIRAIEVVGPGDSQLGLSLLAELRPLGHLVKSAILNVESRERQERLNQLAEAAVDEVDLLLHVSGIRLGGSSLGPPVCPPVKRVRDVFSSSKGDAQSAGITRVGIGLGDVFRAKPDFVCSIIESLCMLNPCRFVLYDTVGVALPQEVGALIAQLARISSIPLHVHFHNDLGMATANTLIAIQSGASGADVTVGGVGDRCGNASLEVVALVAERRLGIKTGVQLADLTRICRSVLELLAIPVAPCAPIFGPLAFCHSASSHYAQLLRGHKEAYEPYPPETVGQTRRFLVDASREMEEALREYSLERGYSPGRLARLVADHRGKTVSEAELEDLLK